MGDMAKFLHLRAHTAGEVPMLYVLLYAEWCSKWRDA